MSFVACLVSREGCVIDLARGRSGSGQGGGQCVCLPILGGRGVCFFSGRTKV